MTRTLVVAVLTLLLGGLSCQKDNQPNGPIITALPGTVWQLQRIDTVGSGMAAVLPADTILLTFDDERHLSGASHGLCGNTYFGVYTLPAGDSLHADSLSSTKAGCLTGSLYWDYYTILHTAEQYQRQDRQLSIYCNHKSLRLLLRQVN